VAATSESHAPVGGHMAHIKSITPQQEMRSTINNVQMAVRNMQRTNEAPSTRLRQGSDKNIAKQR